jgi:cytochrome c oxidase assembly protein subunit 11
MDEEVSKKNIRLVKILTLVVIGMFAFGYALVPLYDVLCELTGLNGKTETVAVEQVAYPVDNNREINVEFLTTLNSSMPMEFHAETKQLKIHPGEYHTVYFTAKNMTDKVMDARAIPSFSPGVAREYFKKTECFCFNQQTFKPRESKRMPMRFVVKPDFPKDLTTITLSYTFFDNTKATAQR